MSAPDLEMVCLVCWQDMSDLHGHSLKEFLMVTQMRCPRCQGQVYLDEEWDSYVCPSCVWFTEEKCSNPRCLLCSTRPDRPVLREAP